MDNASRLKRLLKVARMYYERNYTQSRIAKELGISHATISRMLNEARETGLVEIVIHYPWQNDTRLETALLEQYSLRDVRVLAADDLNEAEVLEGVGVLAAELVESHLQDGMTLAISRGRSVYATARAIELRRNHAITVVQMQGALEDELFHERDVSTFFTSRRRGEFHYLHVPMVLESSTASQLLLQEPSIQKTLDLARNADLALVGIGTVDPGGSSLLESGVLSEAELRTLDSQGVVGDVCGLHFNADGVVLDIDLNARILSISEQDLRAIPIVIGVAAGAPKIAAVRAALCGQLVNMLATDSSVAKALLGHTAQEGKDRV